MRDWTDAERIDAAGRVNAELFALVYRRGLVVTDRVRQLSELLTVLLTGTRAEIAAKEALLESYVPREV